MRLFLFTFCLLLLNVACSSDDEGPDLTPREEFNLRANSELVIPSDDAEFFVVTIGDGDKLVFQYRFIQPSDPQLPDSGYSESIVFEIDPTLTEFSFSNDQLATINAYFRSVCFCDNTESIAITVGTISGERVNAESWAINIDVEVILGSNTLSQNIDGIFNQI